MCTLILIHKMLPDLPVVLASNRDEWLARPSAPPTFLDHPLQIVGGQDRVAQGTWLGVSHGGFFAGVTNQRQPGPPDAQLKSRGALVMDVLRAGSEGGVEKAKGLLEETPFAAYNPFHLMFGDGQDVWVTDTSIGSKLVKIPRGVHVLTNDGLNAKTFPKVDRIRTLLEPLPTDWGALSALLKKVLSDNTPPADIPEDPEFNLPLEARSALHSIRVELPQYGTCSSSLIAISDSGLHDYLHADGTPGVAPFIQQGHLL